MALLVFTAFLVFLLSVLLIYVCWVLLMLLKHFLNESVLIFKNTAHTKTQGIRKTECLEHKKYKNLKFTNTKNTKIPKAENTGNKKAILQCNKSKNTKESQNTLIHNTNT